MRRTLVTELADTAIRTCAAFGVLGALWWGVKHPEHVGPCKSRVPAHLAIQHCISSTIGTIATHWALLLGAGVCAGAAAGLVIALLIARPFRA